MRFIELTAVNWRNEPSSQNVLSLVEDDLEIPQEVALPTPAETFAVTINVDDIREFYPRRHGRTGTRVVFKGGAARPVMESYAAVQTAIAVVLGS